MSPSISRIKTNDLVKIGLFSVLTWIGALIQIPMYPVPFTLQTFMVMMSGLLLGPSKGVFCQIVYILMGLLGLPVFSGGGGLGYLLDPRFGFIMGFVFLAFFSGLATKRKKILWIFVGMVIVYLLGITHIWIIQNYILEIQIAYVSILKGMLIFIPGDVIKAILAINLTKKITPRLGI